MCGLAWLRLCAFYLRCMNGCVGRGRKKQLDLVLMNMEEEVMGEERRENER